MTNVDLEKLLNEPFYAFDFQFMIGDVEGFLDFSESNIQWQFRREIQDIRRRAEIEDYPREYIEHLEANAEHRFNVSLPLRVRYAAMVALITSVEWSVNFLVRGLKTPISKKRCSRNQTVYQLLELEDRVGLGAADTVFDFEALVQIRNCIAHSAGVDEHYKYRRDLLAAIDRLSGFRLENKHFFGKHIWIDNGALNPYMRKMDALIVSFHKAVHERDFLHGDMPSRK
jgi:hypothetical protein